MIFSYLRKKKFFFINQRAQLYNDFNHKIFEFIRDIYFSNRYI